MKFGNNWMVAGFVLASLSLVMACGQVNVGFNQYNMAFDEAATFDKDKKLKFTDVLDDSRCPLDVECVQEGVAIIELRANCEQDTFFFDLRLSDGGTVAPDTVIFELYKVHLTSVLPERLVDDNVADEDYIIRVVVEKLKK